MTENGSDRDERIAQAIAEFNDLRVSETTVDLDQFVGDYPDLEPDLKDQLLALLKIELLLGGADESGKEIGLPATVRISGSMHDRGWRDGTRSSSCRPAS